MASDPNRVLQDNAHLQFPLLNFYDGVISVDVAAKRNSYAYTLPSFNNLLVGAFAGLIFRIQGYDTYDALAIRFANGDLNSPTPVSALTNFVAQISSPPSYTFNTLLGNSTYSAGAHVAEGAWTRLTIVIRNNTITASSGFPKQIFFSSVPLLGQSKPG